jgi:hypothetical protein
MIWKGIQDGDYSNKNFIGEFRVSSDATSLKGLPKTIYGNLIIEENNFTDVDLKYLPENIFVNKENTEFDTGRLVINYNNIKSFKHSKLKNCENEVAYTPKEFGDFSFENFPITKNISMKWVNIDNFKGMPSNVNMFEIYIGTSDIKSFEGLENISADYLTLKKVDVEEFIFLPKIKYFSCIDSSIKKINIDYSKLNKTQLKRIIKKYDCKCMEDIKKILNKMLDYHKSNKINFDAVDKIVKLFFR